MKYKKAKLDCQTWKRKHRLIHMIQKKMNLTEGTAANLLHLPESALQEIFDKIKGGE